MQECYFSARKIKEGKLKSKLSMVVTVFCILAFSCSASTDQAAEESAVAASKTWLSFVDDGRYSDSWDEAATFFKSAVTNEQWLASMKAFRMPLGKSISRKIKSKQYTTSLPGAPDGKYVVIQYETSFEHKKSAIETITPMLDKDGTWRVSGYYIK